VHGTRIQAAPDPNERPMHCHHEKLVVIDDEVRLCRWHRPEPITAVIATTHPSFRRAGAWAGVAR
jgi:hypothetical protein